jgi:hypothetical protein
MLAVFNGAAAIVERLFAAGATLPDDPVLRPAAELLEQSGVADLINRSNGTPWEGLWERRVRIDEIELTSADLERHAFWEVCGDEHDSVETL